MAIIKTLSPDAQVIVRTRTGDDYYVGYMYPGLVAFTASADYTGEANTKQISIEICKKDGGILPIATPIEVAVFDSETGAELHSTATFSNASEGEIIIGEDAEAIQGFTSDNGRLTLLVTNPDLDVLYIACSSAFGSIPLDCRHILKLDFS